jgi:DivIVA domain-containing protein
MALTPEDVRNKQFSTAKRKSGYEMDEVDAFLDQVELELGALQRENAELRGRLAAAEQGAARAAAAPMQPPAPAPVAAPAPPPPAPAPVQNVSEQAVAMLALAQRTADEHTTRAKIEAEDMIASARAKVVELERQGQIDRAALERRVEELRAFEREYRTRLRQHYESALRELEGRADAPAAAAPTTPAPAAPAPAAPVVAAPPAAPPAAPAVHMPPPPPGYQPPAPTVPGTAGPTLTPPPPPAPNPFTPPPAQG